MEKLVNQVISKGFQVTK